MPQRPNTRNTALLTRAAADLFYERGIHQTTVDAIAERASVTKQTLYQHFQSKDHLIEAALRLRDAEHRMRLAAIVAAEGSTGAPALAAFDLLAEYLGEGPGFRGCALVNAAIELPDPEHPGRRVALEHKQWLLGCLAAALREGSFDRPDALAEALLFLLEGATIASYTMNRTDAAGAAKQAARMLLDAHAPRRQPRPPDRRLGS